MKRGGLNDLDKLLAASSKRQARIKAADEAIHGASSSADAPAPTADADDAADKPMMPPPPPAQATAAAAAAAAAKPIKEPPPEPTSVAPIFSSPPTPMAITPLSSGTDPLIAMLASSDADEPNVRELLRGGWVHTHYARRACPEPVLRWLFAVSCHHRLSATSAAAARTLNSILSCCGSSSPAAAWVPGPAEFLHALERHGAALGELGPSAADVAATAANDAAAFATASTTTATTTGASTSASPSSKKAKAAAAAAAASVPDDPRQNLVAMLELLPTCCRQWRGVDLALQVGAVRWMARLMLDAHTALAFIHLQEGIAAVLENAKDDGEYKREWVPLLLVAVRELSAKLPHASLVRLLEALPPTLRAAALQRHGAVAVIGALQKRRAAQHKVEARRARRQRKEQREVDKMRREEAGVMEEEDGEEEEEEEESEEEDDEDEDDEDEEAEEGAAPPPPPEGQMSAAQSLYKALEAFDVAMWAGKMEGVHSALLLTDLALSSDPRLLRQDRASLGSIKRRLNTIKQKAMRCRGVVDYHGLECESLASYLSNKLEHCFLTEEDDEGDSDDE